MAGKITELSELTAGTASTADLIETVDISDTSMAATGTNKKMNLGQLAQVTQGNTLTQATDYTDARIAALEARIVALEEFIIYPVFGTLGAESCYHVHTASEPTLIVAGVGTWTLSPASASHAHTASSPTLLPEGPVEFTLQVGAASFTPWVQLQGGSTTTVSWYNSADTLITTGLKPTIARPTDGVVKMLVTSGGLPAMNQVDSLNLGFESTDDPGEDNIGPGYNHPGQPVTDCVGFQLLTGMRYFMAAHTPLRSAMNCTGMSNLLHIEVFQSNIPTMDLTGCTSLIRVCVEGGAIEVLDMSPVKNNLHDLRAGRSTAPGGITFLSDGPMTNLYHYCVVYQDVNQHLPSSQLPVVEQYWVYDTGMVSIDPPTSPLLNSCLMGTNPLIQSTVDSFILHCANNVGGDGRIEIQNGQPPSPATDAARASLISRGWEVDLLLSDTVGIDGSNGTWTPPTHQPWVLADLTVLPSSGQTTTVTSGVLTTNNNGYFRTIFRPGGRTTRGSAYFEVAVDRSEVDPAGGAATQTWGLIVNADANGAAGARCLISWPSTNTTNANGVAIADSRAAYQTGLAGTPPNIVTRVNPNPAGWTSAGTHKVGLYLGGDSCFVVLDGVKVYKCQNGYIDNLGQGPYCGLAGDSNSTDRIWQSWGFANVTL